MQWRKTIYKTTTRIEAMGAGREEIPAKNLIGWRDVGGRSLKSGQGIKVRLWVDRGAARKEKRPAENNQGIGFELEAKIFCYRVEPRWCVLCWSRNKCGGNPSENMIFCGFKLLNLAYNMLFPGRRLIPLIFRCPSFQNTFGGWIRETPRQTMLKGGGSAMA